MKAWRFNGMLIIAADNWVDARGHAMTALLTDQLEWEAADVKDATIRLEWTGTDAGKYQNRKLTVHRLDGT